MENKAFEQKMNDLERLIKQLEANDLPLNESLSIYEKAMNLSKELSKELEEASAKVQVINEKNEKIDF